MCPCDRIEARVCQHCAQQIERASRVMSRWLLGRAYARWKCEVVLGGDYFLD